MCAALRSDVAQTEEILRIVGDHLGVPRLTLSLDDYIMDDLGADSLDRLELIMTIEEAFGIRMSEEAIQGAKQIRDITIAVGKHLVEEQRSAERRATDSYNLDEERGK